MRDLYFFALGAVRERNARERGDLSGRRRNGIAVRVRGRVSELSVETIGLVRREAVLCAVRREVDLGKR